jgi:hypothetical protein
MAGGMNWLNTHLPPERSATRFVYRCTDPDCEWTSPPLHAWVSAEAVQRGQKHPHPVEYLGEVELEA